MEEVDHLELGANPHLEGTEANPRPNQLLVCLVGTTLHHLRALSLHIGLTRRLCRIDLARMRRNRRRPQLISPVAGLHPMLHGHLILRLHLGHRELPAREMLRHYPIYAWPTCIRRYVSLALDY